MRPIGLNSIFFLLAVLGLFFVQLQGFAEDPGLGWHLASGRWISTNLALPAFDPFLFSATPRPWLPEQWLADLVLFKLYDFGSWPLLYVCGASLYLLTFLILVYPTLCSWRPYAIYACLATLIAFKMGQVHFLLRPVLFNYPLFAAVLAVMLWPTERLLRWKYQLILGSFLVFAFWANLHPAFVLGLLVLILRILSELVDSFFVGSQANLSGKSLKIFGLIFLAASIGTLVNPFGLELYQHIFWHSNSQVVSKIFVEWLPTQLMAFEGQLLLMSSLLVLLALLFARPAGSFYYFLLLIFLPWAFSSVRILPFFAIACGSWFLLGFVGLQNLLYRIGFKRFPLIVKSCANIEQREKQALPSAFLSLFLLTYLVASSLVNAKVVGVNGLLGPSRDNFPFAALEFLNQQHYRDAELNSHVGNVDKLKILNEMDWGGAITLYGAGMTDSSLRSSVTLEPRMQAYIDDRSALLGDAFILNYLRAMRPEGAWRDFIAKSGADFLMLRRQDLLNHKLVKEPNLSRIYHDRVAVVYAIESSRSN